MRALLELNHTDMKYLICTLLIIGNIGQLFCQINDTVQDIGSDCVGQENSIISPKVIDYVYWGNTISISGLITANCCGSHYLKREIINDTIYLTAIDSALCNCICDYSFSTELQKCSLEKYTLFINNEYIQEIRRYDTMSYITSSCTDESEVDYNFNFSGDSLEFYGTIEANCGGTHLLLYDINADTINLYRLDTGELFDCMCLYEFKASFVDCAKDKYRVLLDDEYGQGLDTIISKTTSLTESQGIQDYKGLWKVQANVWDGTTERYDNLYFDVKNDSVEIFQSDSIVARGKIINDTLFVLSGFEFAGIDWIGKINADSLVSSPANCKQFKNLSFERIDLSGHWLQYIKHWRGEIEIEFCMIVQKRDSVFYYSSTACFATAYIKKDSIVVVSGFEEIGIDYFRLNSTYSFEKVAPLLEAVDYILFVKSNRDVHPGQFTGKYSIEEISSSETIPNYSDTINYDIEITFSDVDTFDIQFVLNAHFYDTIRAKIWNDSIFEIPIQEFIHYDSISLFISGYGKLSDDSIEIEYIAGGSMDTFRCTCKGIKNVSGLSRITENKSKIQFFPNPVKDFLNLDLAFVPNWNYELPRTIVIFNTAGSMILRREFCFDKDRIPVSDLIPGNYFFIILNGNTIHSGCFVKQ